MTAAARGRGAGRLRDYHRAHALVYGQRVWMVRRMDVNRIRPTIYRECMIVACEWYRLNNVKGEKVLQTHPFSPLKGTPRVDIGRFASGDPLGVPCHVCDCVFGNNPH